MATRSYVFSNPLAVPSTIVSQSPHCLLAKGHTSFCSYKKMKMSNLYYTVGHLASLIRPSFRTRCFLRDEISITQLVLMVDFHVFCLQCVTASHHLMPSLHSSFTVNVLQGPHHLQLLLFQHIKPLWQLISPSEKHLLQALPLWNKWVICLMFERAQTRLKGRESYYNNVFPPVVVPGEHP